MNNNSIVFFDSDCVLCSRTVRFLIKWDKNNILMFCSLKSVDAENLLSGYVINPLELNSIVFLHQDRLYLRSEAILQILSTLPSFKWLYLLLKIIPKPIQQSIYTFIAVNRYQILGKNKKCQLPNADNRHKFIDLK